MVAGGRNEEGSLASVEVFDLTNEKWTEIGQPLDDGSDDDDDEEQSSRPKISLPDMRNSAGGVLLVLDGKPTLVGGEKGAKSLRVRK